MPENITGYAEMLDQSIRAGKHREASALIDSFREQSPSVQDAALSIIGISPDDIAYTLLERIGRSGLDARKTLEKFSDTLLDRAHVNAGFIIPFIQTAEDVMLEGAAPLLNHILQTETDPFILLNTLTALGKVKTDLYIDTIADFIYYNSNELMTAAVDALAQIGSVEAFEALWHATLGSKSNDHIISALSRANIEPEKDEDGHGDQPLKTVRFLIKMLTSVHVSIKSSASRQLIRIGKPAVDTLCLKFDRNSDSASDILHILGHIGERDSLKKIYSFAKSRIESPDLRYALFKAAGDLSATEITCELIRGLSDRSAYVKMASAAALDRMGSKKALQNLRAVVETGGRDARQTVSTIIDSRGKNLFSALLESDSFTHIAAYYLQTEAPLTTRRYFVGILKKLGKLILAEQIMDGAQDCHPKGKSKIFIIGREKPLQSFILKTVFDSGFSAREFMSLEEMLSYPQDHPPSLIITTDRTDDFFVPGAAELIYKKYTGITPPILMFSLRRHLMAEGEGILLMQMPDKTSELVKTLKELVN